MRYAFLVLILAAAAAIAQEPTPEATPRVTGIDYDFRMIRLRGEGFTAGQVVRMLVSDGVTTRAAQASAAADGTVAIEQRKLAAEGGTYQVAGRWGGVTYPLRAVRVPGGLELLGEAFRGQDATTGTLTAYLRKVAADDGQTTAQQAAAVRRLNVAAALWTQAQMEREATRRRAELEASIEAQRARLDVTQ
jgi:hypothetical protein